MSESPSTKDKKVKSIYTCSLCEGFDDHTSRGHDRAVENLRQMDEDDFLNYVEENHMVRLRARQDLGFLSELLTRDKLLTMPKARLPRTDGKKLSIYDKLTTSPGLNFVRLLVHWRAKIKLYQLQASQVFELAKQISDGSFAWDAKADVPVDVLALRAEEKKPLVVQANPNGDPKVPVGRNFKYKGPLAEISSQTQSIYDAMLLGGGEGSPPLYMPVSLLVPPAIVPELYAFLAERTASRATKRYREEFGADTVQDDAPAAKLPRYEEEKKGQENPETDDQVIESGTV